MKCSDGGSFVSAPHRMADRQEVCPRSDQRRAVGGGDPANCNARYFKHRRPELEKLEVGAMLGGFGLAGKERSKRNVVGPPLARLHRQMAAGVTGHADLCLAPQTLARLGYQSVLLPQMDAVGTQSPGQCDAVVDDERAVGIPANPLEWLGELCRFVLVDAFDAELEGRDRPRPQRTRQAVRKGAADFERRDHVKLAVGVWHRRASIAVTRLSQAFRNRSFDHTIVAGMKNALILLAPLVLAGCVTAGAEQPTQDGLTYARINQTVRVGGPRVTPLKVIEDSRCPMNARCVWAGQVRLSVRITTDKGTMVREIVSNKPLAVADGALTLAYVLPDRRTDAVLDPRQYRFGFRFDGGI
jgi:hypothetical protein